MRDSTASFPTPEGPESTTRSGVASPALDRPVVIVRFPPIGMPAAARSRGTRPRPIQPPRCSSPRAPPGPPPPSPWRCDGRRSCGTPAPWSDVPPRMTSPSGVSSTCPPIRPSPSAMARSPVRLLGPQLRRALNDRGPPGEAGRDGQHGDLVHQTRDDRAADFGRMEVAGLHSDVRHLLSALQAPVLQRQAGAHVLEDVQHAGASGVYADAADQDVGLGVDGARHQPEGGGADVPRHAYVDGGEGRRPDGDAQPVTLDVGAHWPPTSARCGPWWLAGSRTTVWPWALNPAMSRHDLSCALAMGIWYSMPWRPPPRNASGALEPPPRPMTSAPHLLQRAYDAVHRASAQRLVAGDDAEEGPACQQPGDQAHGGAAIAGVQHSVRLREPVRPLAVDDEAVLGLVAVGERGSCSMSTCRPRRQRSIEARSSPTQKLVTWGGPRSDAVQERRPGARSTCRRGARPHPPGGRERRCVVAPGPTSSGTWWGSLLLRSLSCFQRCASRSPIMNCIMLSEALGRSAPGRSPESTPASHRARASHALMRLSSSAS